MISRGIYLAKENKVKGKLQKCWFEIGNCTTINLWELITRREQFAVTSLFNCFTLSVFCSWCHWFYVKEQAEFIPNRLVISRGVYLAKENKAKGKLRKCWFEIWNCTTINLWELITKREQFAVTSLFSYFLYHGFDGDQTVVIYSILHFWTVKIL